MKLPSRHRFSRLLRRPAVVGGGRCAGRTGARAVRTRGPRRADGTGGAGTLRGALRRLQRGLRELPVRR